MRSLTLETLGRPGWITSSTNCLRERRRLVMNLRVRRVTAAAAFESAMAAVGRLLAAEVAVAAAAAAQEDGGRRRWESRVIAWKGLYVVEP
jgi:hypothetical protein